MSRWIIHSDVEFDAIHALVSYKGGPEEPHSHRWRIAIQVATDRLNAEGYAVDFHRIHEMLAEAVNHLQGCDLNLHPEIGVPSPTAERLAETVAGWLDPSCRELGASLAAVSVWEGPENRVDLELL